jgi:hypothetical protein
VGPGTLLVVFLGGCPNERSVVERGDVDGDADTDGDTDGDADTDGHRRRHGAFAPRSPGPDASSAETIDRTPSPLVPHRNHPAAIAATSSPPPSCP